MNSTGCSLSRIAPSSSVRSRSSRSDQLRQFVCKQQSDYPKYLVLDPLLLNKLEYLLERVNAAGYHAKTFFVMSGYRTPYYNRSIGNVALSRHVWGAAADIYIDEDGDGYMDDINGDGVSNIEDVKILYRIADREAAKADYEAWEAQHKAERARDGRIRAIEAELAELRERM